jgi:predicted hydrocarbon binding protein
LDEAKLSTEFTILQKMFQGDGNGLLRMTEYSKGKLIVFQVQECAECFGIRDMRRAICYFVGGKLAGATQSSFQREVGLVETKCAAQGDPYCEFRLSFQE